MEYILLLLLLLNTSLFFVKLFNKKIEETLFLSIFSYILILFLFGILGSLHVGFISIITANIILFIYNIYTIVKKKINLKELLTPGFIMFLFSFALVVWYSLGRLASHWDEFSHWALVVKNMYGLNNLGIGPDSTVMIKNYLSGTSLFQYFCVKLSGSFNETMLYVGMDILMISLIIPMFKIFKEKKNWFAYIIYFIMFFIPLLFFPTMYNSLYVDAILGLTYAYSLYSYFYNRDKKIELYDIINLMSSFAMLIFIKDFGLVLLLISFVIILLDNMFIKNKFKFNIKKIIKDNYLICITVIPALLIKIIWGIALNLNDFTGTNSTSSILSTVMKLLSFDLLGYQSSTIGAFANATFTTKLTDTYMSITYFSIMIFAGIIGYFAVKNASKNNKKTLKLVYTLIILGAIGYAGLILLAYLSIFSEYEALRLASFNRYMSTYAVGLLFVSLALLMNNLSTDKQKFEKFSLLLLFLFTINFNFYYFLNMTLFRTGSVELTEETRSAYKDFAKTTQKYLDKKDDLYFISTNDNGIDYYIAKYELSPIKMNKNFGWSIGKPYSKDDIWTVSKTKEEWKKELLKDYEYVYLFDIDPQFIDAYGELFENSNIEDNQLYEVIESDSNKILKLVTK